MNSNEIIRKLREPFQVNEIEWKIQATTQDKSRGMACAYVDARAIQKRLDDVVGAFNWRNEYHMWQEKAQICGISLYCEERKEWVTKYDGAPNSDYEEIKGGLSDSFKRAAIQWGIGRYLYELGSNWVDIEPRGKSYAIKQDQYPKLEAVYNKSISQFFNIPATFIDPLNDIRPLEQEVDKLIVNEQQSNNDSLYYKVKSIKPSGASSQLLELIDSKGEVISAYIKKSDDTITVGSHLSKVSIVQKKSSYGPYNLISTYEKGAA